MNRRGVRQHSFICMLAVSFLMLAAGFRTGILEEGEKGIALNLPRSVEEVQAVSDHSRTDPETGAEEPELLKTEPEQGLPEEEEAGEPETAPVPVMRAEGLSYFDDALFIGDSRTVGLSEYGNLGNAEVIADSGMNVYKIFEKEFVTVSGEEKTLEAMLEERQFGKIYVMLGINELGYEYDRTVERYVGLLETLEEKQPDAVLFLQANLHITGKKSETSPVYTNENLNRFNAAVERMADGRRRFYLDVNELFDDEEGNLSEDYTADNAHVLGKYYKDWVNWLLEHAVVFETEAEASEPDSGPQPEAARPPEEEADGETAAGEETGREP